MDQGKKYKVLIIEDNLDLLEMYKLKFSSEGFDVHVAEDGEKGILAAIDFKPDAILLDILMPNMDGYQVLKTLRDNTGLKAKIIVLSNLGQEDQIQKALDLGASEFMVKSNYQPSQVVERIRNMLGIEAQVKESAPGSDVSKTEKVEELQSLLKSGVITQAEYDKLISRLS